SWLSAQVLSDAPIQQATELEVIAPQLKGTSPDGAFRMIFVFGGGTKAYRGARIQDRKAWLSSERMAQLLNHGLEALQAWATG
ncbi:hypothetical protein INO36_13695, partial [Staphylococcus aureus]|nr:hypothetical protein [Staphylococcus aureus]